MTTTQKIFSDLRKFFLHASKNPDKYRQRPKDFTRKRKLHFFKLALFQISLLKKVSKPNLTKFLPIPNIAPKIFKNYRLWACDTTCQLLPDNEETRKMGVHKNQHKQVASIKISGYFDIFNKIITQFALFKKQQADLLCCLEQVKNVPKDVISIYDRAYGSQILPFLHKLNSSKYLIRLKTNFSNTVKNFIQSNDNESFITEPLSERTYKRLEEFDIRQSKMDMISYRLVKIILPTGEIEVLMTNLDTSFTINDLAELYRLRWGIETCFFCIKSFQMLGTFSGYSQLAVRQDIYVNLLFYNLQTIAQLVAEKKVKMLSIRRKSKANKKCIFKCLV